MALDTAHKRYAALHVGSPWRSTLPVPDGTIAAADRLQLAYLYSGIAADQLQIQVLFPLRRFIARSRRYRVLARERLYRLVALGEYAVQTFPKLPTETYALAIDFGTRLPLNAALASGTLAAIDEATAVDATATVLASATATIQGDDAVLTPQAGTAGHDYLLTLSATLSTGAVLVEQVRMQVRSTL